MKNIIETALGNTNFTTLVTALNATDLVQTLSGTGPFTVLAPTNDAFAKFGEDTVKELLEDKEKLTSILKHHVLAGKIMSKDLQNQKEATPLSGDMVKISKSEDIMINDAKVSTADIVCSNGVIHEIDTVLTP